MYNFENTSEHLNIYIVRHCKATGQLPEAELTDKGYLQAEVLAEFLSDKNIEYIISSPFHRAIESISPLARRLQVNLTTDDRLKERILCNGDHPNWQEMLRNTFMDLDLCYEGGESSRTAINRAVSVISDIRDSKFSNVVLVTHGNLMSLLIKYYDDTFGFDQWKSLSNPDVYHLQHYGSSITIKRIWIRN